MTIESRELFDLCKQVYKATGWTGTNQVIGIYYQISEVDVKYGIFDRSEKRKEPVDTPLYTSDYLLEKLPSTIKNEFDGDDDYLILYKKSGSWYADYMGQFLRCKDDTPLKALLKLCLALKEAGEL